MIQTVTPGKRLFSTIIRWFDTEYGIVEDTEPEDKKRVDWFRIIPFAFLHAMCLLVFYVGWSPVAVIVGTALLMIRIFAVTGFYHRYFSHKSYKTNRFWQFVFAVMGNSSVQRGPLWWAAHHRHHHKFTDQPVDVHSPRQHGFWWSHIGWITSKENFPTKKKYVKEWLKYPELRWINRYDTVIPVLLAISLYVLGFILETYAPGLGTSGWQMVVWGFFISTTLLFHLTATINSIDHLIGSKRYQTPDTSRNNVILAILTMGEGWHNNHHHYAVTAKQGFFWWEIDMTYYILVFMSWLGIVWDLRPVPDRIRNSHKAK